MSEQRKSESKPDDLTKTTEPRSTELTAEELEQVSGGKDVPPEHHQDLDFIVGMLDWDANVDPEFAVVAQTCSTAFVPVVLAPGASCTYSMYFYPTKAGLLSATAWWSINDQTVGLVLSGTGTGTPGTPNLVATPGPRRSRLFCSAVR